MAPFPTAQRGGGRGPLREPSDGPITLGWFLSIVLKYHNSPGKWTLPTPVKIVPLSAKTFSSALDFYTCVTLPPFCRGPNHGMEGLSGLSQVPQT